MVVLDCLDRRHPRSGLDAGLRSQQLHRRDQPQRVEDAVRRRAQALAQQGAELGLYPPGSTFKPMVAMALLQAGIDPKARVNCPGGFQLGNRFFRCLGRHGSMTMHTAIARSCNTYFYAMGRRAGIDIISAMGKRLGFGQKFDLPVVSQNYGTMPSAEWKKARYERSAKLVERPDWTESDTLNTSIGQGFVIVNPLQLAVMSARIASGRDIQPNLLRRQAPAPAALPFPKEHFDTVRAGMWEVVNGAGTAGRSKLELPGIEMGGKTGTAQVRRITGGQRGQSGAWKYRDHGLFVCFAPTANPRYAGSVVIEHGMGGARAAAPVAKDVLTYLFDKPRALAALATLRGAMGRHARRADGAAGAELARRGGGAEGGRGRDVGNGALMGLDFVPAPVASLPWRLLWIVFALAAAGVLGLYSAAGGSMMPWALPASGPLPRLPRPRHRPVADPAADLPRPRLPRLWRRPPAAHPDARARRDRRRRPKLARARLPPDPAVRADEADHRPHPRPLLRPCSARRDRTALGDVAARADPRPAASAHPAPAGSRHDDADRPQHHRPDVPRRPAAELVHRRRGRRRGGASGRLFLPPAASAGPGADLPQPGDRPARRRLSPHPVEDRDRLGRRVRQGLPERHPEPPPLSARAAYRLHLLGDRRGMGADRRAAC